MMKVVASLVLMVLGFVPVWFWMHFSKRNGDIFRLCSIAYMTSKCVGKIYLGFWFGASKLFWSICCALWKVTFSWSTRSRITCSFFCLGHCRSPARWCSEQWVHFVSSEVQSWLVRPGAEHLLQLISVLLHLLYVCPYFWHLRHSMGLLLNGVTFVSERSPGI